MILRKLLALQRLSLLSVSLCLSLKLIELELELSIFYFSLPLPIDSDTILLKLLAGMSLGPSGHIHGWNSDGVLGELGLTDVNELIVHA